MSGRNGRKTKSKGDHLEPVVCSGLLWSFIRGGRQGYSSRVQRQMDRT